MTVVEDELAAIGAIYEERVVCRQELENYILEVAVKSEAAIQGYMSFTIRLVLGPYYPSVPPSFVIIKSTLVGLTSSQLEYLENSVMDVIEDRMTYPMIYDLLLRCHDFLGLFQTLPGISATATTKISSSEVLFGVGSGGGGVTNHVMEKRDNRLYALIESIKNSYDIVKIEDIQHVKKSTAFEKLCDRARTYLPQWGFHGTDPKNIPDIIKNGLLVPGTPGITVKNGAAYGVGIYVARDSHYWLSAGFSPQQTHWVKTGDATSRSTDIATQRLLIVKVLPDRRLVDIFDWGWLSRRSDNVLVCYAIDIIRRNSVSDRLTMAPKSMTRTEMKEYASRHLPTGYGTGTEVLDVAPHDDDDDRTGFMTQKYYEQIGKYCVVEYDDLLGCALASSPKSRVGCRATRITPHNWPR